MLSAKSTASYLHMLKMSWTEVVELSFNIVFDDFKLVDKVEASENAPRISRDDGTTDLLAFILMIELVVLNIIFLNNFPEKLDERIQVSF